MCTVFFAFPAENIDIYKIVTAPWKAIFPDEDLHNIFIRLKLFQAASNGFIKTFKIIYWTCKFLNSRDHS